MVRWRMLHIVYLLGILCLPIPALSIESNQDIIKRANRLFEKGKYQVSGQYTTGYLTGQLVFTKEGIHYWTIVIGKSGYLTLIEER